MWLAKHECPPPSTMCYAPIRGHRHKIPRSHRLRRLCPARFRAGAAASRTSLAVFVVILATLIGTPVTGFGAQRAGVVGQPRRLRQETGAQQTQRCALLAAVRTVVIVVHVDHLAQTTLTIHSTTQTRFNAGFSLSQHQYSPYVVHTRFRQSHTGPSI